MNFLEISYGSLKLRLALGHKHILKYDSRNRAEQGHLGLFFIKGVDLYLHHRKSSQAKEYKIVRVQRF